MAINRYNDGIRLRKIKERKRQAEKRKGRRSLQRLTGFMRGLRPIRVPFEMVDPMPYDQQKAKGWLGKFFSA
ncbi:hypothetical protein ACQV2R_08105 [Facklamia sp. P12937]|uniref:hypothetical protein n=1 Tax=Facklamia sp. P12937 TaxID=3421949 RepID=UPI003D182100